MRYEVRTPAGKLIGLYEGPQNVPVSIQLYSMPGIPKSLATFAGPNAPIQPLSVKEITLERGAIRWSDGITEIPVLVLRSGKRTWLNGVRGFRRI